MALATIGGGLGESIGAKKRTYNKDSYRNALDKIAKNSMRRTRQVGNERANQMGQRFASQGINNSPLAAFLQNQNRTQLNSKTLDYLSKLEADLEMEFAHTDNMLQQQEQRDDRGAWNDAGQALVSLFGHHINKPSTEVDPEQTQAMIENLKWLEENYPEQDFSEMKKRIEDSIAGKPEENSALANWNPLEAIRDIFSKREPGNQELPDLPSLEPRENKELEPPPIFDQEPPDTRLQEPTTEEPAKAQTSALRTDIGATNYDYIVNTFFTEDELLDIFNWDV